MAKPPVPKVDALSSSAEAFIRAAPGKRSLYPWEQPGVRENAISQMLLRLREPLSLKIGFILDTWDGRTPSRHSVITEWIEEGVRKELEKRGVKE